MKFLAILFALSSSLSWGTTEGIENSAASNSPSPIVQRTGIDQKLGAQVPGDLTFRDEKGAPVKIGSFFGKHPVVFAMVYYECPSLCNLVMNGIFRSLQEIKLDRGNEFSVVFVSINPKEKPQLAADKLKKYVTTYLHSESEAGMHFLTGDEAQIQQLAKTVGFKYEWDPNAKVYAHPGALMVLTPEGKVSRYMFGVDFPSKDLRLALVEASGNQIGTPIDHFLLYCYKYDPSIGKYGVAIMNVLRLLGAGTVVGLAFFILFLSRSKRKARSALKWDTTP